MHDGMPYGRNQGQGQGHSREVDRQSPTGLIFFIIHKYNFRTVMSYSSDTNPKEQLMTRKATKSRLGTVIPV